MALVSRLVGALSRRSGRPELLAAIDATARRDQREETAIAAIMAASLRSDSTYVDVGTNRGQLLRQAVRVAPQGRHVAFEPIPELAAVLARAFPIVDCRQIALSKAPRTATFCHFRRLDGWSGLRRNTQISDERGDPDYIEVEVSTLDAQAEQLSPALIKIDVEGAELDVIEGASATLLRARPLLIFEHVASTAELYEAPSGALWRALDELGYEVFTVTGEGPFTRDAFASSRGVVNWLARPVASDRQRGRAHTSERASGAAQV
jgi:FkbM family methyltransferase